MPPLSSSIVNTTMPIIDIPSIIVDTIHKVIKKVSVKYFIISFMCWVIISLRGN